MNSATKQAALFTNSLINTTRAFEAACAARNAFDFWAPQYIELQILVDTLYARMHVLQDAVPRWWEVA